MRTRDALVRVGALAPDIALSFVDGRLDGALLSSRAQNNLARELKSLGFGDSPRCAGRTLAYVGRPDVALRGLEEPLQAVQAQRSVYLAQLGRHEESRAIRDQFGDLASRLMHIGIDCYLMEAAILRRDVEPLSPLLHRLAPLADRPFSRALYLNYARLFGDAASVLGEPELAKSYYVQAIEACGRIRFRPEIALSRLGLAELLLDPSLRQAQGELGSGNEGNERAEALEHLDFAIGEFREMKMQPALERALKHKGLLGA